MSGQRVEVVIELELSLDRHDPERIKEDSRLALELTQRVKDVCGESRYAGILETAPHMYDVG